MTPEEKKEFIKTKMTEGDKRSYNEIQADLELQIWSKRYSPIIIPEIKK